MLTEQVNTSLFDYATEKVHCDKLIGSFADEITKCENRRALRDHEVNVPQMRTAKQLGADEIFVPMRRINSAILRMKPQMDSYMTSSRRLLIFKDKELPGETCEDLEIAFTDWMKTPGWEVPWYKLTDGTCLHGGNGIEVVYDPGMPFRCRIDYIPREDLIFNPTCTDIQKNERILRHYKWYPYELRDNIKVLGLDPVECMRLYKEKEETPLETFDVYRVYARREGMIYIYWYIPTATKFVKEPQPLESGMSMDASARTAFKNFPIWFNTFMLLEQVELLKVRGLAFWQLPAQEGETQIVTSQTNAAIKASKVLGSQEVSPGGMADAAQTEPIQGNVIVKAPVKYYSPPMPDGQALKVAQYLTTEFSQDIGQTNFAAMNRQDSRKTAKEIGTAEQTAMLTGSIFLEPLGITATGVLSVCWAIGQAAILRGEITNFPVPVEKVAKQYHTFSAGSVDYIARQEKKNTLMQLLPQLGATPVGQVLLELVIRNFLPEDAEKILKGTAEKGILVSLFQALQALYPSIQPSLTPQENEQLSTILRSAAQYIQQAGIAPPQQGTQGEMAEGPGDEGIPEGAGIPS